MDNHEFEGFKKRFDMADTETKVEMYVGTEGLSAAQYRELLSLYPINKIDLLEAALG